MTKLLWILLSHTVSLQVLVNTTKREEAISNLIT
jgi:hypothetical protein